MCEENDYKNHRADVRQEYSELSKYFNTVISFRFTLLGFYLAAVGLILKDNISFGKAVLLIGISLFIWCLDLRNRTIYYCLTKRGMQIERQIWGYKGNQAYDPFYSAMMKEKPHGSEDPNAPKPP